MFAIFTNDSLINFWSNQPGDIFMDATIRALKLNQSQVDMVYFHELNEVPEHYEFDAGKNLIIKKKIVTQIDVNGEIQESVSYEVDKVLDPEVYFAKGLVVKPC